MTVFVLIGCFHYEPSTVLGVFSSEYLAKRREEFLWSEENKGLRFDFYEIESFYIDL